MDPAQTVRRIVCSVDIVETGETLYAARDALQHYLDGLPIEAGSWLVAHKAGDPGNPDFGRWSRVIKRAEYIIRPFVPEGYPPPVIRIGRPRGRPKQPPKLTPEEKRENAVERANASRTARIEAGQVQTNVYLKKDLKEKAKRLADARRLSGLSELLEMIIDDIDEDAWGRIETGERWP